MANGGLLAVTFTDMAVLCARNPHVCFYKYGSAPLAKSYCHEMALRMVLRMINEMANRQQKYIEPLLSLTVDFYVRLFIRVKDGAQQCHTSLTKYSHVFQCWDCESHYLQPVGYHMLEEALIDNESGRRKATKKTDKAKIAQDAHKASVLQQEVQEGAGAEEEQKEGATVEAKEKYKLKPITVPHRCTACDGPLVMGGPIWNAPIHNIDFVKRLLESTRQNKEGLNGHKVKTHERISAILSSIIDEDYLRHVPLSYEFSHIASTLKVPNPRKGQLIAAFNSLGYLVAQTYYDPKLFKTDAPPEVIYDIFKAWKNQVTGGNPDQLKKNIAENSLASRIMQREIKVKPNFNEEEVQTLIKIKKVTKYLPNPEPNWGPKGRAIGSSNAGPIKK